jgi:putative hydrolase of the HAD superfamily
MQKVIVFDLGGVIVNVRHQWRERCEAAGVHCPLQSAETGEALDALYRSYHAGDFELDVLCLKISALLEQRCSPDQARDIHRAILNGEYSGVGDIITGLQSRGHLTALFSNTCSDHWEVLKTYPTVARMEHHFVSYEMGWAKPDLHAYQLLQERLQVEACAILFFDDLMENVQAARRAGWRAEHITLDSAPAEQLRHHLRRHQLL